MGPWWGQGTVAGPQKRDGWTEEQGKGGINAYGLGEKNNGGGKSV